MASRQNGNTYTYDYKTGNWIFNKGTSTGDSSNTTTDDTSNKGISYSNEADDLSTNTDNDSSPGATEKEYNYIEMNTLSGQIAYIATESTIKLTAGDTVFLLGLGKYLSGLYYVKEVTRSINSNGYTQSAVIMRTDVGDNIKLINSTDSFSNEGECVTNDRKKGIYYSYSKASTKPQRIHTVTLGETLWSIAKDYYGDGSKTDKIIDAETGNKAENIKVGQKLIIK